MAKAVLSPEMLELMAASFKALAEPGRLHILNVLRTGELTVTELAEQTGLGQANLSKHLQLLHTLGYVTRRKDGLFVYYALADEDVFELCDIMCGRIGVQATRRRRALGVRHR